MQCCCSVEGEWSSSQSSQCSPSLNPALASPTMVPAIQSKAAELTGRGFTLVTRTRSLNVKRSLSVTVRKALKERLNTGMEPVSRSSQEVSVRRKMKS